jgi:hypothetical protein
MRYCATDLKKRLRKVGAAGILAAIPALPALPAMPQMAFPSAPSPAMPKLSAPQAPGLPAEVGSWASWFSSVAKADTTPVAPETPTLSGAGEFASEWAAAESMASQVAGAKLPKVSLPKLSAPSLPSLTSLSGSLPKFSLALPSAPPPVPVAIPDGGSWAVGAPPSYATLAVNPTYASPSAAMAAFQNASACTKTSCLAVTALSQAEGAAADLGLMSPSSVSSAILVLRNNALLAQKQISSVQHLKIAMPPNRAFHDIEHQLSTLDPSSLEMQNLNKRIGKFIKSPAGMPDRSTSNSVKPMYKALHIPWGKFGPARS